MNEFHVSAVQRTSSVAYFAVRKEAQDKLPQFKPGPTIYAIGLPVIEPLPYCTSGAFEFGKKWWLNSQVSKNTGILQMLVRIIST